MGMFGAAKSHARNIFAEKTDTPSGLSLLKQAIAIHEGHMDGTIPTSMASQKKMMDLMVAAYRSLSR